jgi:nucleoid-associated protein YgaU
MGAEQFEPTSRYSGLETGIVTDATGVPQAYVLRRFPPQPERLAVRTEHVVVEGDRLDRLAATYLGDPEQFWRICDANRAMRPDGLTEQPGRRLRITLPDGFPGVPGA